MISFLEAMCEPPKQLPLDMKALRDGSVIGYEARRRDIHSGDLPRRVCVGKTDRDQLLSEFEGTREAVVNTEPTNAALRRDSPDQITQGRLVGIGRAEDKVKVVLELVGEILVGRRDKLVGAQSDGIDGLGWRVRKDGHVGAERLGELDGEMAQSSDADDTHILSRCHAIAHQRRVDGRAGAEQGADFFALERVGNGEDELLVDSDHARVAALGEDSVGVGRVVGVNLKDKKVKRWDGRTGTTRIDLPALGNTARCPTCI